MFNISVKNTSEGRKATLAIHGDIVASEYWSDEAGEDRVRADLAALNLTEADTLTVTINSRGGDYFAGVSMYNTLKALECTVITKNVGLCASAATLPFMAGDERICYPGTSFMVHDPLTGVFGNADDMREIADRLDEICESAKGLYLAEGVNPEKLVELMKAETMMNPAVALEHGFATSVSEDFQVSNSLSDDYINEGKKLAISNFKKEPKPEPKPQVENKASADFIVNACREHGASDLFMTLYDKSFTESEINATLSSIVEVKSICAATGLNFENLKDSVFNQGDLMRALITEAQKTDDLDIDNNHGNEVFSIKPITGC